MPVWFWAVVCGVPAASIGWGIWWVSQRRLSETERAWQEFKLSREVLEAKFFDLARSLGKPRGVRWLDCQWIGTVRFARDRESGMITAFAGVNIRFEAIEGGDMEDVAAVGLLRDAVALFHYQNGYWGTGGKTLFNMDPPLALQHYANQFEELAIPGSPHS